MMLCVDITIQWSVLPGQFAKCVWKLRSWFCKTMFNCWTDTMCLQQFGVMNIFRSPETRNIRAWWTVLRFRYFSENYMYSYVVIKDTETWGGSLLRLIMDTMTIWIIPMGKYSKYLLRKSLQRILGRFQISFQEGGFLYVEGEGIALEEDTRDGHVSPSGNGCTYPWLGYVQQFDLQKVFVFLPWLICIPEKSNMESENTYHWQRRNMDTNHQFYPIFWGVRPSYWCTKLRYLLCPVALQPGCRWNPGRLTGRWLGWLFSEGHSWASTVPWSVWVADW